MAVTTHFFELLLLFLSVYCMDTSRLWAFLIATAAVAAAAWWLAGQRFYTANEPYSNTMRLSARRSRTS